MQTGFSMSQSMNGGVLLSGLWCWVGGKGFCPLYLIRQVLMQLYAALLLKLLDLFCTVQIYLPVSI